MTTTRRATISVPHEHHFHSSAPTSPKRTCSSHELENAHQQKQKRRRMTVCGDLDGPRFSSPQAHSESVNTTQPSTPEQRSASPALSSGSSSSSAKSVRFDESGSRLSPGQYSPYTPKSSPRSILKYAELPSLFNEQAPIVAANAAIDAIIRDLITSVKSFKQPSELDFSGTPEDAPLVLAKNDQNRPFIDQLCKLARLRNELAEIPTHGDSKLEGKHRAAGEAIERAIKRMKEHQLMLYSKSGDLDMWFESLKELVDTFSYPPQLDFFAKAENNLTLLRTERNTPFIIQLNNLAEHRAQLHQMYSQSNQKHSDQWQIASDAIEQAMQDMKDHQLTLWKQVNSASSITRRYILISHLHQHFAAVLNSLLKDLNACVQAFEYPSKLDFPPNAESGNLVLLETENNKPFIKQFRVLSQFRDQLCAIKTHGDEHLENKHKVVGAVIVKSLQKLQKHHRERQEEHIKARK
ncbi:unnamed protein product [Rhizoctonia solani]|uniref:Uncharacterized protein n=1 Tax=Rhizoctonia solani TaxID=456999 RepID=A0A8H3HSD3_9AGAM|nr:unnamed protein product [Rhizoctonia solani]